jgi:hypothetical protein
MAGARARKEPAGRSRRPAPARALTSEPPGPRREPGLAQLQRAAGNRAVAGAMAGGQPLDPVTRALAESRYGEDFAGVRIHSDAHSAVTSRALGALAYTVGSDIVFAPGRYDPRGAAGRRLLGHELAHVVQQRRGGPTARPPAIEQSARAAGERFASGAPALQVDGGSAVGVDRQDDANASTIPPNRLQSEAMAAREWLAHNTAPGHERDVVLDHLREIEAAATVGADAPAGYARERDLAAAARAPDKLRDAPTPTLNASNPLIATMQQFTSIKPSAVASGIYEGDVGKYHLRLSQAQYDALRAKVRDHIEIALRRTQSRVDTAAGRYAEQQKVDAHHWIIAPIVKALGGVKDPGVAMYAYVGAARGALPEARKALAAGDFVRAAQLAGDAEGAAERAAKMVAAYVDQIIGTAEMTVTVLEGVKTASEWTLFLCAVAATGGAAGGLAAGLGLEATAGSATAATWIAAGSAIAGEVGVGIMKAADGDKVDWGEIAVHAAIQVIVARFSPGLGQRLANGLAGNPLVVRYGTQRVVSIATSLLMTEGASMFATVIDDAVRALRGKEITWAQFGQHLLARLTDPKGLLMAALAGALGGLPAREPEGQAPAANQPPGSAPKPPKKSPTDNADWRPVNKALGIKGPSKKATPAPTPPPGHKPVTAEEAFRPTAQETAQAYAGKSPTAPGGQKILESANASPRGSSFQSASAATKRSVKTATRPDVGESEAYKAALAKGELGLERPQGVNVPGRADFITAARDAVGKLWIIGNDAKTVSSASSSHPEPAEFMPTPWRAQIKAAVERASFGDPALEAELAAALNAGRVMLRQVNVDYRPTGQGDISGIKPPSPVPWGPMVRPPRFDDEKRKR